MPPNLTLSHDCAWVTPLPLPVLGLRRVGVLHGDVRLSNFVLPLGGGSVKIVDFERSSLFTPGDAEKLLAAEEELAQVDEL